MEKIQYNILKSFPDKTIKLFSNVEETIEDEVVFDVEFSARTSIVRRLRKSE